jgi:hypothetical protein
MCLGRDEDYSDDDESDDGFLFSKGSLGEEKVAVVLRPHLWFDFVVLKVVNDLYEGFAMKECVMICRVFLAYIAQVWCIFVVTVYLVREMPSLVE